MATNVQSRLLTGNDIAVYLSKQSDKGAVNENPIFIKWRRTGGKGKKTVNYTQSGIVKDNRQARAQVQDSSEYNFELQSEASKQAIDDFISAIHGEEELVAESSSSVAAANTGFNGAAGFFNFLSPGDYVWASGFTDPAVNRCFYVESINGDGSQITTTPPHGVAEPTGNLVTFTSHRTLSGKAQTYYAVQTRTTDLSKTGELDFHTLRDAIINTASIEIPETGLCTYTLNLMAEAKIEGSEAIAGQTDGAGFTDESISVVQHIKDFFVDGVSQKCEVKSLTVEINNNYQTDSAAACEGMRSAFGDLDVSGSINVRSMIDEPFTWRDYYESGADVSIAVVIEHSDGDQSLISITNSKVTEWDMPDGSNVIANSECSFSAQEDPVRQTTIEIYRNWIYDSIQDNEPEVFFMVDVDDADPNDVQWHESNEIDVEGLSSTADAYVTSSDGGQMAIRSSSGGTWSSWIDVGTTVQVSNGYQAKVRVQNSDVSLAQTSVRLYIGTLNNGFEVVNAT